jgi:hypothetical protein
MKGTYHGRTERSRNWGFNGNRMGYHEGPYRERLHGIW